MMGIISYSKLVARLLSRINNDDSVSAKNKELLEKFLYTYDVSDARKGIFLERIYPILKEFKDISNIERDAINAFFYKLKKKYAPATVSTYSSILCRFSKWLNDGTLAPEFLDIVQYSRKRSRRKLQPEDMISWDDGLTMAKFAPSPQIQAIATVQLDGGFRPSEFISLNYGDVSIVDNLFVCHVRDGKTGARHVVLFRATPYLKQWMDMHPTRNPSDPLWINETNPKDKEGKLLRYKYPALAKRIKTLGKLARINKPLDFYNLRHSSCTLDKKDNIPAELASERHGHSIKYYMDVYGRLNVSDTVNRFKTHFGMESGMCANPMEKYAVQPHIIKPSASEGEAFAQQYAMELQIQQMQKKLAAMQQYQPVSHPFGLAPQQNHPTHPAPTMYTGGTTTIPSCGIPQTMQSYKNSHL